MRLFWFCVKFVAIVTLGSAALAGSVALIVPAGAGLGSATTPLANLDVNINTPPARSVVYDRFGNVMTTFATQDRSPVKLSQIPQVLIDAVISVEDRKFYEHHGVDWAGTIRALFKNVDAGTISQGGSTITQQLVKNTLSTNRKRDLKTKAREAILAIRLEHEMTKNQILEDYLNLVYFGNGAYGVQAAAERYFPATPLKNLSLAQAALLAGLIQAPEADNPIKHPDAAARRRSEVLDAMVANDEATRHAADVAKAVPLPTTVSYPHSAPLDYYLDEVKNQLLTDNPNTPGDPGEILGSTQQARANAVFRGGLKIYTAYDSGLQLAATAAVNSELPKSQFTASLVVIDNSDGGVRAIANGRTFAEMQFDPATEGLGRQAGSSFKVFTLADALSQGYNPSDTVSGSPGTWSTGPNSAPLVLTSNDDCNGGHPTLSTAIAISDNCAFIRTELSLGPGNHGGDGARSVIAMAKAMGITSTNLDPVLSTTLGTNPVHPLDMAQAYSVLPNEGILKPATLITKIVNSSGKTIYQAPTRGKRVLDTNVARTETQMLEGPPRRGTAAKTLGNFPRPIAGKTGTTDNSQDAWYIGYTPQLTAAVWMGNPLNEEPMVINGSQVFGADYPARIWRSFMSVATQNLPPLDFAPPNPSLWKPPRGITDSGRNSSVSFGNSSGNSSGRRRRSAPPPPAPAPPPRRSPPTTARTTPTTAKPPKKSQLPKRPSRPRTTPTTAQGP